MYRIYFTPDQALFIKLKLHRTSQTQISIIVNECYGTTQSWVIVAKNQVSKKKKVDERSVPEIIELY